MGELRLEAFGSAATDEQLSVALIGNGVAERFSVDTPPLQILSPMVQGEAALRLKMKLLPIGLPYSGTWSLAAANQTVTATANVQYPGVDDLFAAALPYLTKQFDTVFGDQTLGLLNAIPLPLASAGGPSESGGNSLVSLGEDHRHNESETERAVLAHFDTMAVKLGIPGVAEVGGSISNLDILSNGLPDFRHASGFSLFGPNGFLGDVLEWVPLELNEFRIEFGDDFFPETGGIDLTKSTIIVSGALKKSLSLGGSDEQEGEENNSEDNSIPFPFHGSVKDLRINVDKLSRGEFPIENLSGIKVAIDPSVLLKDTPFVVRGEIGFERIEVDDRQALVVRLVGDFKYEGIGAGIESP